LVRLRIGILSRWNATCGISLHAELVAREWAAAGHKVVVFAPYPTSAGEDWHHKLIEGAEEEPWVMRCYDETDEPTGGRIDIEKVLSFDMDVMVIEIYGRLPARSLGRLVRIVRSRGVPVVGVVHLTTPREFEPFAGIELNAYVVFDRRYVDEILARYLPKERLARVKEIPYPCVKGLRVEPRRPGFASGKVLFFTFGRQPPEEYRDYLDALDRLSRSYDLVYWVIRSDGLLRVEKPWLVQWRRRPPLDEVYSYLKAADVHLIPKSRGFGKVVVSSTVYQTLAAYVPTVIPDGRYVETIPSDSDGIGPVVKYKDLDDLTEKLRALIEDDGLRRRVVEEARRFVERHGSDRIAARFVELFEELLSQPLRA